MEEFFVAIQKTPVPTLLIVAGLLFILLGFVTKIGGIIEVSPEQKQLTLPVGMSVLLIGLLLNFNPTPEENPVTKKTFSEPMYAGLRLDVCYEWADRCGEEPAREWCKTQGFKRAVDYPTQNVGNRGIPTKLIGTQKVCNEAMCTSFEYITCE